jgi:hypothetical protein
LVINYISTIWGVKELAAIGLLESAEVERLRNTPIAELQQELARQDEKTRKTLAALLRHPGEILPSLELQSNVRKALDFPFSDLAKEFLDNHLYLFDFVMPYAAAGLLTMAWETTRSYSDHSPIWEFLRHCRNASGHNGRLHFVHDEPKRPAEWRGIELLAAMDGTPLMHGRDGSGLPGAADPVFLLMDIEKAYPAMSAS